MAEENQNNVRAVIEAALFISETPVTVDQLKQVLQGFTAQDVRREIDALSQEYMLNNRGVRIMEVAGGFRMVTPPALSPFLKKLFKEKKIERLSKPALETLAIIAYKQPVTRLEIESIRSVKNVDAMVKSLEEKEFIKVVGERQAPGRPKVYGTTRQFLEYFGLRSLEDLPAVEDFSKLQPGELEAKLLEREGKAPQALPDAVAAPVPEAEPVQSEQKEGMDEPEQAANTN